MSSDSLTSGLGRPLVVVVGGGNAGVCAAIAAHRCGASVLLLEKADRTFRGGNSRHTRDIRYAHAEPDAYAAGSHPEEEFLADLATVTDGRSDIVLARRLVADSVGLPAWMSQQGVAWQGTLHGALHLSRTNAFFLGGGRALLNAYYDTAIGLGVRVAYDTPVVDMKFARGGCTQVIARTSAGSVSIEPDAVVLAAGGLEANLAWLHDRWGSAADNFVIRGTAANDGGVLQLMLDAGVQPVGDERRFHAVAVDARSPRFDGGIVTRIDAIPYGIVLNRDGLRFYDEGETYWPKRYAIWGRLIAEQPDQRAVVVFDARARSMFIPPLFPPIEAPTLAGLAVGADLPVSAVLASVATFNASIADPDRFDATTLDGCATSGLQPPKSNWARAIEEPPYYAYPLRPGITFTYRGLRVDSTTRVVGRDGRRFDNVFAAGELMAGNILTHGYLAGVGLTIGTVFGRIAGTEAASAA